MIKLINNLENHISDAVAHYWQTRKSQREKQKDRGVSDAGLRSAVTGGAQTDGFIGLFTEIVVGAGLDGKYVFRKKRLELPGFFRPTKEWDLVVVKNGHLVAAIEAKSQVGPSFGNNFNNRTEEAMG
ncbi:MAG: restriction endonuclease, partial [Syntrophobacterales bacterium CG23_combo_of_CG06-09_8_20_14_all_48_27]